jgi:GH24 family phage-related lysozyme (muramidase)
MRTYKEQIKVPNSDTMTPEKENKLKGSISEFLENLGESSAAKYIQEEFSTINPYSKQIEKIEKERNEELVKISMLNSGILDKLESIEKSLKKGQDTSVQSIVKPTEKTALQKVKEIHTTKADNSFGLFDLFLSGILGAGMLSFLKGFKNIGPIAFALKLVQMGWEGIKDKIKDLVTSVAKNLMKPMEDLIQWMLEKLSKIPGLEEFGTKKKNTTSGTEKSKEKTSTTDKKPTKAPTAVDSAKLEKEVGKEVAKVGGKSLAKKIPLLGLGAAAAFAVDRVLDGDVVGAGMEVASGILGTVGPLTFGAGTAASFGVDAAIAIRDIKRAKEEVITRLDDAGIIDKGFFGDTTIEDWERLQKLPIEELRMLSELGDLDENDEARLNNLIFKMELERVKEPTNLEEFNESGVKVIFNEREILADALLESDNKLQDFILKNPFTEDNVEKTETEIDGKKVLEIKYKDENLNAEYIRLKEKYDEDFKKYKETREAQLRNVGDAYDIDGNTFSEQEYNAYQNLKNSGYINTSDFYKSAVTQNAQKDVAAALNMNLKNITIPTGSLVDRIKKNEGYRLTQYIDSVGRPTIGYGHLIKPNESYLMGATITPEQAEALFAKDFAEHKAAAEKIPSFNEHSKAVQDTLIDMTYNMGPAWYKNWPNTIKSLTEKNYETVKNDILSSRYASQVKGRALVNAKVFEKEAEVKSASENVSTPTSDAVVKTNENINILNKENAIEQKQEKAQTAEEINKNLVKNTSSTTVVNNYNTTSSSNNTSADIQKAPLSALFGSYS